MVGGVLLLVGAIFIASKFKEPVNRPLPKKWCLLFGAKLGEQQRHKA
jgi:hypothetical protein